MGSSYGLAGFILAIFFGILCMPIVLILIMMVLNGKKFFKRGLKYLAVTSILPLIILCIDYAAYRVESSDFAGIYYLNQYPDCSSCVLNLFENNMYTVTKDNHMLEHGTWKYVRTEFFFVKIGEYGRLGSRKYTYYKKKLAHKQ
ncbi:MAG: hypothetical protein AAF617_11510 [Bacteroidota bacterium]